MKKQDREKISKPAQGITWDLSDLYQSINDPKIAKDKEKTINQIKELTTHYKGKINTSQFNKQALLAALKLYESIFETLYIYGSYASYLHSKNTQDEKIGRFFQESEEFYTMVQTQLMWFELEIIAMPDAVFTEISNDKRLQDYHHYLQRLRIFKPFTLSENEEMILTQKAQTSSSAFIRLYDQLSASDHYPMSINRKIKELSYSQLAPYLTANPDRKLRKAAAEGLTKGLEKQSKLYTYILNTLLLDKKVTDEIRGYTYPQEATLLSYEIKPETVKQMTNEISKRYAIGEKFYQAKKKLLGVDTLYEWDRYSPVYSNQTKEYSWDEAKEIVLDNFQNFSPVFRQVAEKFITYKWIDAEITPGKRDGAYCSYNSPSKHPYILLNFAGTLRDVETLAHELGHGIHGYLAGEHHNLFQAWPSTATAEIASVFCETVVFESLYQQQTDKKIKIAMLADKIQSNFATIFRQNAFYLFESDIHAARREKGELSTNDFNTLFQKRIQSMFGKGLTLTEGHKYWWMPILHFYHYNFYVFSYAFGQMMTMALYARYKQEGKTFVDDYIRALTLGGSEDPYVVTKTMGVDVNAPDFWDKGLDYIEKYVDEFIELTK